MQIDHCTPIRSTYECIYTMSKIGSNSYLFALGPTLFPNYDSLPGIDLFSRHTDSQKMPWDNFLGNYWKMCMAKNEEVNKEKDI